MAKTVERKIVNFFSAMELRCRCWRPTCQAKPVKPEALRMLNLLRYEWGKPLVLSSAVRCPEHNAKVGGSPKSRHMEGDAFDIKCLDRNMAMALAALAEKLGFTGIGVADSFVHVDTRPGSLVRWEYP